MNKCPRRSVEKINKKTLREFTPICDGVSILRGCYSQNHYKFSKASRNNQSITNAIAAIVMSRIDHPKSWTCKNMNVILDSGDSLYRESWFYYKPFHNPNLGLENILRTFRIDNFKVTTKIYKSTIKGDLVFSSLFVGLLNFFLNELSGIVCTTFYNIAIFQRDGHYYMFDPYDRDGKGNCARTGLACTLEFTDIKLLAEKIYSNALSQARAFKINDSFRIRFSIYGVAIENATSTRMEPAKSFTSCHSNVEYILNYKPIFTSMKSL